MNKGVVIAIGLAAVVATGWLVLARSDENAPATSEAVPTTRSSEVGVQDPQDGAWAPPPTSASGEPGGSKEPRDLTTRAGVERAIALAETELREAQSALREADLAIDDLEREVDAVERYVENLRQRGEDPARHAEEGMEKLGPLIERYETRLAVAERADAQVVAARIRLEEARSALATLND